MNNETKVIAGIGILTILILGVIVFFASRGGNLPAITAKNVSKKDAQLVRADSDQIKAAGAKVTVVEFGDYQCPYCAQSYPVLKQINTDYQGKINFVFRNFPLSMHAYAQPAARAAEAAGDQGKYWEMHDKLYENQDAWSTSLNPTNTFVGYARDLKLDVTKFKADMKSSQVADKIAQDMGDGNGLGVNATPTVYINGTKLDVEPTYDNLKAAIDKALSS